MRKERNNIILMGLVINIVIFVILITLLFLYFYPKLADIENKKANLSKLVNTYYTLKEKGLPYSEFKKIKDPNISAYQQKILWKIDKNFYEKNFLNNGKFNNFSDFLNSLEEQINWNLKEDYREKYNKIYKILPIYAESSSSDIKSEILTDFKFVNMLENLLYEYDLISESPLWIKEISKLNNYSESKNKSDLSSDIYVIKLPLTIEWKKKNIIKFLTHIQNMWKIKLCNIKDKCEKKWELIVENSAIFTELNSISMWEYIDSSPSISIADKDKNLLEILTQTIQKNERFKLDIELLFYVQWLPNYKIKEFIKEVIWTVPKNLKQDKLDEISKINYSLIKSRLKKLQNKYKSNKLILQKLNNIDSYLKSIDKDIKGINKEIPKSKDLMAIYNKVQRYKWIFLLISKKLDEIESKEKNN